jgi:anti-sigma factor RsiW
MACQTIYDDMMSSQLDGLLDAEEERILLAHIGTCAECAAFWSAMMQADTLLVTSARQPAPVPVDFTVRVMERVATIEVVRPEYVETLIAAGELVPVSASILPPMRRPLAEYEEFPIQLPDYVQEWQSRIATYVRGMAAVSLSIAGATGLLLALILSGSLQVGSSFAPAVQAARTFFSAMGTWVSTLFQGVGVEAVSVAGLVLALLALAAWQLVSNYQRTASAQWTEYAQLEAA